MNKQTKTYKLAGILSFFIVLLLMPLGHLLMILTETIFKDSKFISAIIIGLIGFGFLLFGVVKNSKAILSSLLGLLAGVLIWTGWVEFSFVWIAERLQVAPLIENGEVTTKPEYLVMLSSIGLLFTILLYFLFTPTGCQFFNWFQKHLRLGKHIKVKHISTKPVALTTFIETIVILWTFYIVLLLVYDKDIAGDQHPITYIVAFGSLFWSMFLLQKLVQIKNFDYAIRYAIPTVIIFWNFIEIIGRWNLLKEIWVHPTEHVFENSLIAILLIVFIVYYYYKNTQINKKKQIKYKTIKHEKQTAII